MRILCIAAAYPPHGKGGGPKASENIAKALCGKGHIVRVVTVADDESFEVRDGIEVKTLRTLNLYWNYWIRRPAIAKLLWHALENFNPRAFLRMRREIVDFGPDLVVTISIENVNVATWVAAWTLGCPSVHVIHSYFMMCWRSTMFAANRNCERPCLQCRVASIGKRICSQLVDGVIAEASHSLSMHRKYGFFKHALAKTIPGAVNIPKTRSIVPSANARTIRVGYIGMLTTNKGISTLGAAAALLGKDAPFEYFIAGEGEPSFVQHVLSTFPPSRTKYLGWVKPDSFYPTIDVLIVPSISAECFGNVCVEGLSFGIPAIVARSGALPGIIEDERNGFTFKAGDHEDLAACLRKIEADRDLLNRLRRGALACAERYAPSALAASFDAFLSHVCVRARKSNFRSCSPKSGHKVRCPPHLDGVNPSS